MQTRAQSMQEIALSTTVGCIGSFLIALSVMHIVTDRTAAATITTALCTAWSLVRGYAIRRIYNNRGKRT